MNEDVQQKPNKICSHCSARNDLQQGQCISCGRTDFLLSGVSINTRKEGRLNIVVGLFLIGMSFVFLYIKRDNIYYDNWVIITFLMLITVSVSFLINSIYSYRHGGSIQALRYIMIAAGTALFIWQYFS